jgi:hypothetical protein
VATPPTFILDNEGTAGWDSTTTPKTTAAFDSAVGDVWVTGVLCEHDSETFDTPTNTGTAQTFTARGSVDTTDYGEIRAFTTVVANTLSSQTCSVARTAGLADKRFNLNVVRFSGSDGIGAVPAGEAETDGTAPSLTITTTGDNSAIVVFVTDWNAANGASRTWQTVNSITPTAGNGFELTYFRNASAWTMYVGYYPDAGAKGAKTVGISAPSTMKASIVAVEVLGTAAAAAERGGPWFTSPLAEMPYAEKWAPWEFRPVQPPIPMAVWASPAQALTADLSLDDTADAVDALTVAADIPLSDTGTGVDALTVAAAVPLADTGVGVDALSVESAVPLADTGAGVDALTVATALTLDDTADAVDALTVAAAVPLSDTGTGVDALSVSSPGTGTYLNHVTIAAARNGTTSHTIDPSATGTVIDGAAFTPTAGRLLVVVAEGAVTSTTPSGWTLPSGGSAINNTGLYVWHRTAAGGDTFSTTHNASNYPAVFDIYEFGSDSTFLGSAAATGVDSNGGAGPTLSSLTGTHWDAGVVGQVNASTTNTETILWDLGVEEVDTSTLQASGTDGYTYGLTVIEGATSSSAAFAATSSSNAATTERLVFAVDAGDDGENDVALSDTGTGVDALTLTATVALTDTADAVDAVSVAVAASLADTASAADALAVLSDAVPPPGAWFLSPFAELPFAAPAPWEGGLNKGVIVLEVWTSPPAVTAQSVSLTDTATADDSLSVTAAVPLADTASAADGLTVTASLTLADTATAADVLARTITVALSDTATGTDLLTVAAAVPLPDTATAVDELSVAGSSNPSLTELATGADVLSVTAVTSMADTASAVDALTIAVQVTLADTAVAVEFINIPESGNTNVWRVSTGIRTARATTGDRTARVGTGNRTARATTGLG